MRELETKNGNAIPLVGLGTYPLQGESMAKVAIEAFQCGYRLIDTADDYRGETGLGIALSRLNNETNLKREDVFIQTKISQDSAHGDEPLEGVWFNKLSKYQNRHTIEEVVRDKVNISLRELQTDYLDSLLIHFPFPEYYEDIWETMIGLKKEGIVRYIGVSNFHIRHIERLKAIGECPSINEIYISPIGSKQEDVEYATQNNIQLMTYSPLLDVVHCNLSDVVLSPIVKKYEKSKQQIILRWNFDRGCMPLPKTSSITRLKSNFDIFDFKLTDEEITTISSMNFDNQYYVESKQCPGI